MNCDLHFMHVCVFVCVCAPRPFDVRRHRHNPHHAVHGGHVLDPGPALDQRVHSRLHSVLCQVLHHRRHRARGCRA